MSVPAATKIRHKRPQRRPAVRMLQIALPALAAVVTIGVAAQATVRAVAARGETVVAEPLRMDNPRFSGKMNDGRAFLITATSALRDPQDAGKLVLQTPTLIRGFGGPDASQITAKTGDYRQEDASLLLKGDVQIANTRGARVNSQQALIDTRTGDLVNGGPVQGSDPTRTVQAGGYSVMDKGDRVTFKGGVRARLDPR